MKTIQGSVSNQMLSIDKSVLAVSNNVNEYTLVLSFDSEWDDVDKKIVTFSSDNGKRLAIEQTDDEQGVTIPWEVLTNPTHKLIKVSVGVVGYAGTEEKLTTSGAYDANCLYVLPEALGLSSAMTPSPDIYTKILQNIGDMAVLNTEDKSSLVAAMNEILAERRGLKVFVVDTTLLFLENQSVRVEDTNLIIEGVQS